MPLAQNMHLRLFVGAALISLSPVWVRLVDVSPTTSGFYRVFFGSAALAIYLLRERRWRWLVLLCATCFLPGAVISIVLHLASGGQFLLHTVGRSCGPQ